MPGVQAVGPQKAACKLFCCVQWMYMGSDDIHACAGAESRMPKAVTGAANFPSTTAKAEEHASLKGSPQVQVYQRAGTSLGSLLCWSRRHRQTYKASILGKCFCLAVQGFIELMLSRLPCGHVAWCCYMMSVSIVRAQSARELSRSIALTKL